MTKLSFGNIEDYKTQRSAIRKCAKKLRELRPKVDMTWREPADWKVKYSNIHGEPATTLTITLTPTGCEWASTGGCTMCGEFEGSTKGNTVPADFHIAQFATAITKYVHDHQPSWIRIYQEGNYTNHKEMTDSAQTIILRLASAIAGIKRITVESMAKYITEESIEVLRDSKKANVELEVGIGFEAENEVVRNVCVNKGEKLEDFLKAISILRENGIRSLAYVLLKPPFLTESESIDEAISTIQVANEIGFDAVSLEPASIHAYSLVHALYLAGHYQLPWLWSVVKIAQNSKNISDFRIGGFGFYPPPVITANNRHPDGSDGCNEAFWISIGRYGKKREFSVFDDLECYCKEDWEEVCRVEERPLIERIQHQLDSLDLDRYKQSIQEESLNREKLASDTITLAGGTQFCGETES